MIHPPSGPLSSGAWQPPSRGLCPPLIETWLPKADLRCLSPHLCPLPRAVSIRVCAPPGAQGGPGAGYLAAGRGSPPGSCLHSCRVTLGPAVDMGGEVCVSPSPASTRVGPLAPFVRTGPQAGWGVGMPEQWLLEAQGAQRRTPAMAQGWDMELPVQGHVSPSRPSFSPTGKTRHWPGARAT